MRFLKLKKLLIHNFWLKVMCLIIAIIIWLAASGIVLEIPKAIKV